MAIRNISELKSLIRPGDRLLGLDLGTKTIGLAIADATHSIATPLDTIRRIKFTKDIEALFKVVDGRQVGALVLGLPLNMDGSEGPRCQSVRQFATNLMAKREIEIAFWDERLSTAAVTRTLLDADASRKRRGELVDKMAAAYILQGALDAMRHGGPPPR
ncbi:MAG: Holliday junction resolvase RuvX [Alphaproteobacteria bacterium]|nr:Holliday junction resolvase RuvX [Alphaproteobacteria bacterium]